MSNNSHQPVSKNLHAKIMTTIDRQRQWQKIRFWSVGLVLIVFVLNWIYMSYELRGLLEIPIFRILHAESLLLPLVQISSIWIIVALALPIALFVIIALTMKYKFQWYKTYATVFLIVSAVLTVQLGSISGCAGALMYDAQVNKRSQNNSSYLNQLQVVSLLHFRTSVEK